jgi:DNA-binding transcriptional ArsR family regulator
MATSKSNKSKAAQVADLFSLVSSTTRVMILTTLMKKKELAVQDIAEALDMTHSAVSHQLGLLAGSDIVSSKKSGRLVHYKISSGKAAKALTKFLSALA